MRRRRLVWQLYPSYLLVTVFSVAVVAWYASAEASRLFRDQAARMLEARARLAARYLSTRASPAGPDAVCKELGAMTHTRFTIIGPDGTVLGDSEGDPATMENHAMRPEVAEALAGRVGTAIRTSPTLGVPMLYLAIQADGADGGRLVVRAAQSLHHVDSAARGLRMHIAIVGLVNVILASLVCYLVSRRITRPIEAMRRDVERIAGGELDHRIRESRTEELASLAGAVTSMAEDLKRRIEFITARRNEQEAIFASMTEGLIAVDEARRVLRMNQAAGRLLGVEPAAVQGRAIEEAVRHAAFQEFVERAVLSTAPSEGEMVLRNREDHCLRLRAAPLTDEQGRRTGAVILLDDVTQIRRLDRFRRDFVANVSHEIRTPITTIKGFVETLLDGAMRDPKSAERFLSIVARQVDRLNAIVTDLLLLSRLDQQEARGRVPTEDAAISDVIEAAVEVCLPSAQAKGIAIERSCQEGLRAQVNVPLLEQAVVNLLDNAVKYSDPGRRVRVEAERAGDSVIIRVRDEGWGIGAEHLPRIFERFYRVDKGRSREMGGTGLGLAIVKHIAQAHGGSVSVESAPGKGSTFTITIPLGR